MTGLIEKMHRAWYTLDAATDRDEIRTRFPELAAPIDKLNRVTAIQYDAAAALIRTQREEHDRVTETVLGYSHAKRRGRQVMQFVKLGDDYLVQVRGALSDPLALNWTFTVGGKATNWYYTDQEMAILHLVANRYDGNPNSNHMWAAAAARVLGKSDVPED